MFGDMISAGAKLFGGMMDQKTKEKEIAAQREMAAQNIALQKDFAQQGIRWKVEDAKAAGIHPLYALGASTTSFSPVSVGTSSAAGMGEALASAGQDIGRAINTTRTQEERDTAFNDAVKSLTLDKAKLENDVLRTQLASQVQRLRQNASPPMPSVGPVPEAKKYNDRPKLVIGDKVVATDPGTANMQDWSDRYGDEGLPTWLIPPFIMWEDFKANVGQPSKNPVSGLRPGSLLDRWYNSRGRR